MFVLAIVVLFSFLVITFIFLCFVVNINMIMWFVLFVIYCFYVFCCVSLFCLFVFFCLLVGMGTTPKVVTAPFRTAGNAQGDPSLRQPLSERGATPNGMFHPWARWDKDLAHAIRIRAW